MRRTGSTDVVQWLRAQFQPYRNESRVTGRALYRGECYALKGSATPHRHGRVVKSTSISGTAGARP